MVTIVQLVLCCWLRLIANYVTLAVGEVLLLILTFCSLAAIFPRVSDHTHTTLWRYAVLRSESASFCGRTCFTPLNQTHSGFSGSNLVLWVLLFNV